MHNCVARNNGYQNDEHGHTKHKIVMHTRRQCQVNLYYLQAGRLACQILFAVIPSPAKKKTSGPG